MKDLLIGVLIAFMFMGGTFAFAAPSVSSSNTKDEIASLNSLPGSHDLLQLSGGRCWQTCSPCGYMDQQVCCDTNCDDSGGGGGGYSGGGGGGFASPEAMIIGLVLLVAIVAFVCYMASQSNSQYGV